MLFFSSQGRIPRDEWWIGTICIVAFNFVVGFILWRSYGAALIFSPSGRFIAFMFKLITLYPHYCLMAKRFQDRGRSPDIAKALIAVIFIKIAFDLFRLTGDPWVPSTLDYLFQILFVCLGICIIAELCCMRGTIWENS